MKFSVKLTVAAAAFLFFSASYSLAQEAPMSKRPLSDKLKAMDTSHLTEQQQYVMLHDGTERPFENEYWDHHEPGIYVDAITGEALFSSTDKFDSGTGWPSFTKPIDENFTTTKSDTKYGMNRTEVRSAHSDAHLGHVFEDGPAEAGGRRFCINSAALKFVPLDQMAGQGYGQYLPLFAVKR